MKIVNCTKHTVNIVGDDANVIMVIPGGREARLVSEKIDMGFPLVKFEVKEVLDLPDPEEGTVYLVSTPVRVAFPERKDLCSPNGIQKDHSGGTIGVRNLALNP